MLIFGNASSQKHPLWRGKKFMKISCQQPIYSVIIVTKSAHDTLVGVATLKFHSISSQHGRFTTGGAVILDGFTHFALPHIIPTPST